MKSLLLACACVLATATVAAAQTPMGTPPSSTVPPSGSTSTPKPDATIETQSNSGAVQTNPADRANSRKAMHDDRMMKRKNHKVKMKGQTTSTM